jgi:hypothetical protein
MAAAVLLVALAQAVPARDLAHESRAVRDEAVRRLAAGGSPSSEIAALLDDPDERIALGAAEVLRRRRDPAVLPALARAANGPDAARGAAAAAALVATAGEAREVVPFEGMDLLAARLAAAWREAVRETLLPLRHHPSVNSPQAYRAFHAGGDHAARALLEILRDEGAPAAVRAHACHAYARVAGEAPPDPLLADHEPLVREAAAALVLRYGDPAQVAALLDTGRPLRSAELICAAAAVRRTGRVGAAGAGELERAVLDAPVALAAESAAALLAADPERGAKALHARAARHLTDAEGVRGRGLEAALLHLRAGPLPGDLLARMRVLDDPLLSACAAENALDRLRPVLVARPGSREALRAEIVARLLEEHRAPAADRVLFAAGALASGVHASRRLALEALRAVPPEAWAALRPPALEALSDRDESVRLAAVALLLPDARALSVAADALYDGDPWAARRVAGLLAGVTGLARIDARAPVAARRQAARELRRAADPREE